MIAAVLDTNVLASAIAGEGAAHSTPGKLFRRWLRGRYELVLSEHVLAELARTLEKAYFQARVSADQAERAVRAFRKRGRVVPISVEIRGVATHAEDDLVMAAALSAAADFLVTGDRGLLGIGRYRDVRIVTPKAFLEVLDRGFVEAQ